MRFINKFSFHSEIKASQIPSEPTQLLAHIAGPL